MTRRVEASYEILALERERWEVKQVTVTEGDAMAAAKELSKRPASKGVRVVREVFDHSTGLSYGKVVFEQVKDMIRSNVRMAGR